MKIGIDISQMVYTSTGVANYLGGLVRHLVESDKENEYILFFSSLRGSLPNLDYVQGKRVQLKSFKFPPSILDLLWNKLHILPIEYLIGEVDIFISSDWTEPPAIKAKKVTILYDLIVYTHPEETAQKIIETQKRKLAWVKKETTRILCISEATKRDAISLLGIDEKRLRVTYPGM